MTVLFAEIEKVKRILVKLDCEKYAEFEPDLFAAYDGTPEEFARASLKEIAYDILSDSPFEDKTMGCETEIEWDDYELSINGAMPGSLDG